ncbi:MAG: leucine-rich repeat domain-containing protein [Muribaculum sp.]|nr:leucine-rich repeat domain-containing protein [Muribaculum sp.]
MKNVLLLLLTLLMALPIVAKDFEYTYEGQTITYTVISESDKTVMTKEGGWSIIDPGTPVIGQTVSGVLELPAHPKYGDTEYTLIRIPANAFYGSENLTSVTIPNTVKQIYTDAFSGCGLTSVSIPKSVLEIGYSIFYNCKNLTEINVDSDNPNYSSHDGVLYDKNATLLIQFPGSKSYVRIPDTVTEIGISAFYNCQNLTSVELPNSVEIIGQDAFNNCSNLSSVKFGNSVTSIGCAAFSKCTRLSSVELPNTVTTIEDFAFNACFDMASAKIGNSVATIGQYAFSSCRELTSIEIPGTVKTIGYDPFCLCDKLATVFYNTDKPIAFSNLGFYNPTTLYVHASAIEECKNLSPWKYFTNILPYDFSGIDEIENDEIEGIDRNEPYEVYNLNGMRVADTIDGLSKGLYILKQGARVEKIAVK